MMQMIGQHSNEIELVLANNDDMALGAIDAYAKLNITESAIPVFFGIDGTDAGLKAVMDAKLAFSLVYGKGLEEMEFENGKYIYLPYYKVTIDNAEEFLNKAGK